MSTSISIRLAEIEEHIDELHRKTREARDELREADESTIRDHVIEVEQAADSAKRAVETEENLPSSTRDAVFEIHEELSALKDDLGDWCAGTLRLSSGTDRANHARDRARPGSPCIADG